MVAERIAFNITFPKSSETIEIDGNTYFIDGDIQDVLFLVTLTNTNDTFPQNVNATRVWIIPDDSRIFSWTKYSLYSLQFYKLSPRAKSSNYSPYRLINPPIHYPKNEEWTQYSYYLIEPHLVVEVKASNGRVFYLQKKGISIF